MSLEAENDELKTRVFQVEHMNGMLDAQIQKLREDVRVLTHLNEALQAQLEEARSQAVQVRKDKDHWFGYKAADGNIRGAFDMLMVSGWKTGLRARKGWQTTVYAGYHMHDLDDEQTKEFWTKFEKYLNRE